MEGYDVQILPAVFTPMHPDGSIHYDQIEALYQRCVGCGFNGIFLNGTTGECMSLDTQERRQLLEAWVQCRQKNNHPDFRIIVHVGSANILEAAGLAEHARSQGADGIATVPTFYFRPRNIDELIDQCKYVAAAAPDIPFYFYNIPSFTAVDFPLISFMEAAIREIPTFAGLKNSCNDLVDYQKCIHYANDNYSLYWGTDEVFMMVYAAGNRHYVGSTYNFMSAVYFKMLDAYSACDFEKLTALQGEATRIYTILNDYNSLIAGKEMMKQIGIDCGPVRKPLRPLSSGDSKTLVDRLRKTSFFELATAANNVKRVSKA